MLKLFKKIKRNLLSSGNFKKYLVYAAGEILLVMIGILLAIQVSNWNLQKNERQEEQAALSNLKQDFEFNKNSIISTIDHTDEVIEACVILLNNTGEKYSPEIDKTIDSLMLQTINSYKYYPQNGFLNDLINSGKLDIIQNAQLRNLLSSWKPLIESLRLLETISIDFNTITIEYLIENGNFLRADKKYAPKYLQLPETGFDQDNTQLLQELVFENRVDNQIIYQDYKKAEQKKVLQTCEEIIALINKEL